MIRGQGTKFMTAMYHGISICTKRGNPANAFYGELHNTDWDNPENEIDPNPCVANHRVFSHAWIDRARRFQTAGRKTQGSHGSMLPGLMWVDFGLKYIREGYKRAFLA